jgi:sulfatase maturation enzyme AslB (radical SAM superfamily)
MSEDQKGGQTNYIGQVILKVASRCNLNCSYCYVYNRGYARSKLPEGRRI